MDFLALGDDVTAVGGMGAIGGGCVAVAAAAAVVSCGGVADNAVAAAFVAVED